jgi:hypothetical protein
LALHGFEIPSGYRWIVERRNCCGNAARGVSLSNDC